jgi:hypothetical protein
VVYSELQNCKSQVDNHFPPGRNFIVVFDNSDARIELAAKIREQVSDRIVAIYLREVIKKKVPATATTFYTSFDIAIAEFKADRLSASDVIKVGKAILKESEKENIFPYYMECGFDRLLCDGLGQKVLDFCIKVNTRLSQLCESKTY